MPFFPGPVGPVRPEEVYSLQHDGGTKKTAANMEFAAALDPY